MQAVLYPVPAKNGGRNTYLFQCILQHFQSVQRIQRVQRVQRRFSVASPHQLFVPFAQQSKHRAVQQLAAALQLHHAALQNLLPELFQKRVFSWKQRRTAVLELQLVLVERAREVGVGLERADRLDDRQSEAFEGRRKVKVGFVDDLKKREDQN